MSDPVSIFVSWAGAGAGGGAGFLAIKWFIEWAAGRVDKRQEVIDKGTQQLISNLQKEVNTLIGRVDHLEEELSLCRERDARHAAEAAELRAYLHGLGDARQHAQLLVSSERAKDKGKLDE